MSLILILVCDGHIIGDLGVQGVEAGMQIANLQPVRHCALQMSEFAKPELRQSQNPDPDLIGHERDLQEAQ